MFHSGKKQLVVKWHKFHKLCAICIYLLVCEVNIDNNNKHQADLPTNSKLTNSLLPRAAEKKLCLGLSRNRWLKTML